MLSCQEVSWKPENFAELTDQQAVSGLGAVGQRPVRLVPHDRAFFLLPLREDYSEDSNSRPALKA